MGLLTLIAISGNYTIIAAMFLHSTISMEELK
jgi:hypothetical protein